MLGLNDSYSQHSWAGGEHKQLIRLGLPFCLATVSQRPGRVLSLITMVTLLMTSPFQLYALCVDVRI